MPFVVVCHGLLSGRHSFLYSYIFQHVSNSLESYKLADGAINSQSLLSAASEEENSLTSQYLLFTPQENK
jgi:hypothetical protein